MPTAVQVLSLAALIAGGTCLTTISAGESVSGGIAGDLPGKLPAVPLPSVAALTDLLAKAPPGHPRLFADAKTFARVRTQAATDPRLAVLLAAVLAQADAAVKTTPVQRILEGRRLLGVSRQALLRLSALGAAWQLTGERTYADRGAQELLAISAFSDWHPDHFLDTAELTLAAAIGYDWLFDALPERTRATVRKAIVELGLQPSWMEPPAWWVSGTNNWTQVCHAGLLAGALVQREEEPDLAVRIAHRAIANLPRVMHESFAPDGAYPEGPMYWEYGTSFNLVAIDALRSVLGDQFGLTDLPGFRETAEYIVHAHGITGLPFAYADCRTQAAVCSPAQIWFAREYRTPWALASGLKATHPDLARDRLLALALLWAAPELPSQAEARPLDYLGQGIKPVAMFRSAWNDPQGVYLGVCGGSPGGNHGHMDAGSFVFEAAGVRWGTDLGMQQYHALETAGVDLWNMAQDSSRWTVFRLNNHSHSTLVIDGQLQQVTGNAPITAFRAETGNPGCAVDLTTLYAGQAAAVERRFSLPGRQRLVVEDHLVGLAKTGTVRWQMTTGAQVEILADGRQARLTQAGRILELAVSAPADARLVVSEATPRKPYDEANPGIRVLAAEIPGTAGSTIDIQVTLEVATR